MMDNSNNAVPTKKIATRLKIICCFDHSGSHLFLLHHTNYMYHLMQNHMRNKMAASKSL